MTRNTHLVAIRLNQQYNIKTTYRLVLQNRNTAGEDKPFPKTAY